MEHYTKTEHAKLAENKKAWEATEELYVAVRGGIVFSFFLFSSLFLPCLSSFRMVCFFFVNVLVLVVLLLLLLLLLLLFVDAVVALAVVVVTATTTAAVCVIFLLATRLVQSVTGIYF